MPDPYGIVSVSPVLSQLASQHAMISSAELLWGKILPLMPVDEPFADMLKVDLDALGDNDLSYEKLVRAPKGAYPETDYDVTTDSYQTLDVGLETSIDDTVQKKYNNIFDAQAHKTRLLIQRFLRIRETYVKSVVYNAASYGSNTGDVATAWTDFANATPRDDVIDAIKTMVNGIGGVLGNSKVYMAMSYNAFLNMIRTDQISALTGGGTGSDRDKRLPSVSEMAALLQVADIYVGRITIGGSSIWDDSKALIFLDAPGALPDESPVFGRSPYWNKETSGEYVVETYRAENIRSNRVRVRTYLGEKIFDYRCGYLLTGLA